MKITRKLLVLLIFWLFLINFGVSQESFIDSTRIKNPKLAWKLSVIPGLGQIYNEEYVKAVGFMSAEYFATSKYIEYKNLGSVGKRNTWAWWVIGLFVLGMIDAYVDAQLSTFPEKFEVMENQTKNYTDSLKTELTTEID